MKEAFLVFKYYDTREKPLCVIIADSVEEAIRKTGGEPLGVHRGEFQVHIPFEKCRVGDHRGIGPKNTFLYENGLITFEIDPNVFTGGVLALIKIPFFN